jgi:hypothetical protein
MSTFWQNPSYAAFWLEVARGDLATWIQLTPYAYATLEGVHLIGVAFFFGSIFLLDLRLLGLAPRLHAASTERFLLRMTVPAFGLLTASGALLFIPSADRYAASLIFVAKLGAIAVGGLNALAFHVAGWRGIQAADRHPGGSWAACAPAVVSVLVWISVIALGRSMGYERREPPAADLDELRIFEALD